MSPAMVDSPTFDPEVQSQLPGFQSPSSKKGLFFTSTPVFSFDSSVKPSPRTESNTMNPFSDRNDHSQAFATPPLPTKSDKRGLSRPRLVKRRQGLNSSSSVQEGAAVLFGCSESGKSGGDAGIVFGDNKLNGLRLNLDSKSNEVDARVPNLRGVEFGKSGGSRDFGFGADATSSYLTSTRPVESVNKMVQDERMNLKNGSQDTQTTSSNSSSRRAVDSSPNLGCFEFGKSNGDTSFVLEQRRSSGMGLSSNSMSNGPNEGEESLSRRDSNIGSSINQLNCHFDLNSSSCETAHDVRDVEFGKSDINVGTVFGANQSRDEVPNTHMENGRNGEGAPNLGSVRFAFGGNHRNQGMVRGSHSRLKSRKKVSNTPSGSSESVRKKIHDGVRKLNIERENEFHGTCNLRSTFPAGRTGSLISGEAPFVFGSSGVTRRSVSGQSMAVGLDESSTIKLPDEMEKLNIDEARNDEGLGKAKDKSFNTRPKEESSFVFGSSRNTGGSFSAGPATLLPDEMRKLKKMDGPTCGNSMRDTQSGVFAGGLFGGSTMSSSSTTSPTFQAGKLGNRSDLDSISPFQLKEEFKPHEIFPPTPSSSFLRSGFQFSGNVSEATSNNKTANMAAFSFTAMKEGLGVHGDPQTLKPDAPLCSKESLFTGLQQTTKVVRSAKSKKRRGKLKLQSGPILQSISREESSQENLETGSPGSYSPMDFSPYQENFTTDLFSGETSLASDESFHHSVSVDNARADLRSGELNLGSPKHGVERTIGSEVPMEGSPSRPQSESLNTQSKKGNIDERHISGDEFSASSMGRKSNVGGTMSCFGFGTEDIGDTNFTFAASSSPQAPASSARRYYRKKNRNKDVRDSHPSTPNAQVHLASPTVQFCPLASASLQVGASQGQNHQKGDVFTCQKEADNEPEFRHESSSTAAVTAKAQEVCEKWRLRGNQAYSNGNLSKAEEYYTHGVRCVSPKEVSRSCARALMLCYSNRAATRMPLGRMREALGDCMMAAVIEPNFPRVQLRAANCYLALGEIENAMKHFKNCLQSGNDLSLDRKIVVDASDGLQKAKLVADYMGRTAGLLQQRMSDDVAKALDLISEILPISPYSEYLIEMKAEALLMLQKYEEVVQLCELTLDSAEKNYAKSTDAQFETTVDSESMESSPVRLWRWHLISKSYFYLGRLEEALDLLQKHEKVASVEETYGNKMPESTGAFAATVRELLRHKAAGNESFQAGRHLDAVEHYTAALTCNIESRPFAAICFCNRAAAYQALGQISDAIADCSLAIALDPSYPKAISRRATLHEMIRDYGQAIIDLQKLVFLLEKQVDDKSDQSGTSTRSTGRTNDLKQARSRLATMEEELKNGIPLDMYLILGIEQSGSAVDIKKAYRKAALRHHPDKASQFLARSENGDDGLWKKVGDEVQKDADRLFKMIGEAYAVISDPTKRLQYDAEEEIRNAPKKGAFSKAPGDVHSSPFEKSGSRRQWRDPWKSYGNPQQRWAEASRSNRYS